MRNRTLMPARESPLGGPPRRRAVIGAIAFLASLIVSTLPARSWASGDQTDADVAAEDRPTCVPTGYTAFVEWRDSTAPRSPWGDRNYLEIPQAVLFDTFIDRVRRIGIFSDLVGTQNEPHDFDLAFRIERLQRKPISSPDDLWLECSLDLVEPKYGQALWSGRFGISVEARALKLRTENRAALYSLLAKLAADKLAAKTAVELNRFLTGNGLAELAEAATPDCAAHTGIWLDVNQIPLDDQSALLGTLSDSPCYSLHRSERVAPAPTGPALFLRATDSLGRITVTIRDAASGFELFHGQWAEGKIGPRTTVLRNLLAEITEYHHRHGECPHYRFSAAFRQQKDMHGR